MKTLGLILLTYDRMEYAEPTLRAALDNLVWDGKLSVHIADDGSPEGYVEKLAGIAGGYRNVAGVSSTNSGRRGYGANYNLATQAMHNHCEWLLPLEDDWVLTRRLDAGALAEDMEEAPFDCVRLGYLGYTQPLRADFEYINGSHYLRIDPDSPEPHVSAGHPRLERREWQRLVGPWMEGLAAGATEFEWCKRPAARHGVAWPLTLIRPEGDLFVHIGTHRARED